MVIFLVITMYLDPHYLPTVQCLMLSWYHEKIFKSLSYYEL